MRAQKLYELEKKKLELKRDAELQHIKDELKAGYEYVRPINVIKRTLANAAKEPEIREDLFKIGLNMATGYLTNKVVPAKAGGPIKKWLTSFIQEKVGGYVSENGDSIKLAAEKFALKLLNKISRKKSTSPDDGSEPDGELSKSAA